MTPTVIAGLGSLPIVATEPILERLSFALDLPEAEALAVALRAGRLEILAGLRVGLCPAPGEAVKLTIAGVALALSFEQVGVEGQAAPVTAMVMRAPGDAGPWAGRRRLGEAPRGAGGFLQ